jgi:peptide/nickel transport system substrate-binding protein
VDIRYPTKARSLLAEAGYPDGFEMKIITPEASKLETQIMKRMLERIGLKARFEVLTHAEFVRRIYIPLMKKPYEEQEWDMAITHNVDWAGHVGMSFFLWFLKESNWRSIEYDPVFDKMFQEMAAMVDRDLQAQKLGQIAHYLNDKAYSLDVYSPISLYAVNKEVNFVPQKCGFLILKETSVTDNHWSVRAEKK